MILDKFGTVESLARFLQLGGYHGMRGSRYHNPVCLYLRTQYPHARHVRTGLTMAHVRYSKYKCTVIRFPPIVQQFIRAFNGGEFPELEERYPL